MKSCVRIRKQKTEKLIPSSDLKTLQFWLQDPSMIIELASWYSFPSKLYISTVGHGTEKIKTLIAVILILVQISSPICLIGWEFQSSPLAKAVLYSPDTKVPRIGELALRKAIPANTNMKAIQASLEDISFLLRVPQRKPYGTMEGNVKKALKIERVKEFADTVGMCRGLVEVPYAYQSKTGTTYDAGQKFYDHMKVLFKVKNFKELAYYMK
ncbi:hypothetical protein LWI29_024816 [Acer saccharum]|uniref:Peptidyl-prolyl cis-trans isomerase CYP38-like PsbQ-like domain-containing protein n=1 Tax=Acer saccharum TaxID=4024 RepID=A0AA39W542_ACESA|nr:hypothetical protein LWI29_024816 [Acer saccharum]